MLLSEAFEASQCVNHITLKTVTSDSDLIQKLYKLYKIEYSAVPRFNAWAFRKLGNTNYDLRLRQLGHSRTISDNLRSNLFIFLDHPDWDTVRIIYHHNFKFAIKGFSVIKLRDLYADVMFVGNKAIHWFEGPRDDEKSRDILISHYSKVAFAANPSVKFNLLENHYYVAEGDIKAPCLIFNHGTRIEEALGDKLKQGWYAIHTCNRTKDGTVIQPINKVNDVEVKYIRKGMTAISPDLIYLFPALATWATIAHPDANATRNDDGGRMSGLTFKTFPIAIGSPEWHEAGLYEAFSDEMIEFLKHCYFKRYYDLRSNR